jgi:translation initiation factor 6
MTIILADIFGSPNIGVYCFTCESWGAVPAGTPSKKRNNFSECLKVDVCEVSVASSNLLGILLAGNSNGLAVPRIIGEYELKKIKESAPMNIEILNTEKTALGNLILANDHGAIVDPAFSNSIIKKLEDLLQVEVVRGKISNLSYVGSLALATNKGVITHPLIRNNEREVIQTVLKAYVEPSTINGGVPFIRSGLLATSRGAVTGPLTVGKELMTISQIMEM